MKNFNNVASSFINAMKAQDNYKHTTNGAVAAKSTMSKLYDLFSLGASYRACSDEDCILLFKEAYEENPEYALKCLFWIRDIMEGAGERRFFRVCLRWLAQHDTAAVVRNMECIARDGFGRFDDLFVLFDTPVEQEMIALIQKQLIADIEAYQIPNGIISLLAKWMPTQSASSRTTVEMANRFIKAFDVTPRVYRKTLSGLRERIKVVERLMSQNRWEEIDFSKLPSRAGLLYREAFERRSLIADKYREFAKSDEKVNAGKLYPYDVVREAQKVMHCDAYWDYDSREPRFDDTQRLIVNKYWENLKNVFPEGENLNAMVVCDTSGSMLSGASNTASPMQVAVSLAMYAAERANGPFKNHYISFSREARLVEVRGVDFCDKVARIIRSNVCENTNLESVFDLVLDTAMRNHLPASAMPKTLIIVSDMQVDASSRITNREYFMDSMRRKWQQKCGGRYMMPNIVCWNVNASNDTFLSDQKSGMTFVSGCSPTLFTQVVTGKDGISVMYDVLNKERYSKIH